MLWDAAGRRFHDFVAGRGALLLGHNHPDVRDAIREVLVAPAAGSDEEGALGSVALREALGVRLARMAPPGLDAVRLLGSSAQAIDEALVVARLATGRARFVCCERASHGRGATTLGSLGLSDRGPRRTTLDPLLTTTQVRFGDLTALERVLKRRETAAFVVEPVQVEGGVRPPPPGYLAAAAALCRRHGTLVIADESRTGLGRTGAGFACDVEGLEPDALIVGEALGAGVAPIGALLVRARPFRDAVSAARGRALGAAHGGVGTLALAAGIATVEVLVRDRLAERAARVGEALGIKLRVVTAESPLVAMVRGRGLVWGVELKPSTAARVVTLGAIDDLADALVPRYVAAGLAELGYLVGVAEQAPDVLRLEPPLTVDESAVAGLGDALAETLDERARGALHAASGALGDALRSRVSRLFGGGGR